MKQFALFIFAFTALILQAKENEAHHHDHGSHVHGAATVNIAFDGLIGRIEFKAAANGVVGFEHEAISKKDKATLVEVDDKFIAGRKEIFKFDPSLECAIEKVTIGLSVENKSTTNKGKTKVSPEHGDYTANYNVICKKSPLGSKLILDFTQFKSLKDIDATLLIGDLQKSIEIKNKPVTVELK